MRKAILPLLFAATVAIAQMPPVNFSDNSKIAVQNSILAKVNGTTISMMDVKKKMDLLFHQSYPHLSHSSQARYQFYETSWRHVLMEMIDHQLILADAVEKEVKLTDGEIREEMENRFGPNIMLTLDKIGLTYEETWKMIKEELLVQRMSWWFIHSKAMAMVTPQDIRQAYRLYLKENPSYSEWKYRVIVIRGDNPEQAAEKAIAFLRESHTSPESAASALSSIDPAIQVSNEYVAKDTELSDAHRAVLSQLSPTQYSDPSIQISRADNKKVARIFYLSENTEHPAPSFEHLSQNLRNQLVQEKVGRESVAYLQKLRNHYGFDSSHLKETVPDDLHPFSLQ